MAEARQKAAWERAASLMALLANIHRDPKKGRVFHPHDFNPYAASEKRVSFPKARDSIELLAKVFIKEGKK